MADQRRLDGAIISVDGKPLAAELYGQLTLVRVEESVLLPDYFALRFDDPHFDVFDKGTFNLGQRIEIAFRAEADPVVVTVGEVTAVEVSPGPSGRHELHVSGMDVTHRLARQRKSRSYQGVTDSDIASRIAGEYGLSVEVDSSGEVHEYVLQRGETDYAFLRRRAARIGFHFWIADKTFYFKKSPRAAGSPPKLKWGGNLKRFSVRFSAGERADEVQIDGWDSLGKKAVTGRASNAEPGTDAPAAKELSSAAKRAFGAVKRNAGQFPVTDQAEADALAEAFLTRAAGEEVVLRGETAGDPMLGAGAKVSLEQVGSRLSGKYTVTTVEHLYAAGKPYVTKFVCGGREPSGLADLVGGGHAEKRGWQGLVVGIVTNNDDPEKLGRVKVTFPTLSKEDESTWARVVTPGGGPKRGMQWLPEVDDEVLIGFELDDETRPLVLGGLWNRTDQPPQPDAPKNGVVQQRILASRKDSRLAIIDDPTQAIDLLLGGTKVKLHLAVAESNLTGDKKLVIDATDIEVNASNSLKLNGNTVDITAKSAMTLSGKPIKLN
ncbi:type IV secretion protein Rhs [Virgisporangium aliadipatigenens]|uniref:Type IV secretion protein Rhs n=1 Tax=Virgisporangium aliadipatigenens TaxID=741659 RepID=A0A8J3YFB7_9ACTN|nr:VgrG-related protein [Virgisporangium aliadipatigenens]GIJ43218.1 type IV secretion protein Rhs [Virgisporangium aliadipatigenens]